MMTTSRSKNLSYLAFSEESWRAIIIFLLALTLFTCTNPHKMVFPEDHWTEVIPEKVGLEPNLLKNAVDFLEQNSGQDGGEELVIIRSGRLVFRGDSVNKVHGVWSCTKSFTSTIFGLLIDDGKVQLNSLAKAFLPTLNKSYPSVTLSQFASMTSGYKAVGDTATTGYTHGPSQTPFIPDPVPLFHPGAKYAYWDAAMNQFAHVLTVAAKEPLDQLFKRRIADPIGMNANAWYWADFGELNGLKVVGGAGNNGRGIYISASDFARLGLLFLNEGKWQGMQLISRDWVKRSTTVQVPDIMKLGSPLSTIDGIGVYGFNWWVNGTRPNGNRLWPKAPIGTFAASGYNNNKMFIIPKWNMVIVRLGLDDRDGTISNTTWSDFLGKVAEAIMD